MTTKKKPTSNGHEYMRRCAVCGKMFYCDCTDLWAYKKAYKKSEKSNRGHPITWFCSWHCMRENEKTARKRTDGQWARG